MGKNQAYKAMQRAKMASAGGPDEIEDGMDLSFISSSQEHISYELEQSTWHSLQLDDAHWSEAQTSWEVTHLSTTSSQACLSMEFPHKQMDGSFHSPEWHAARLASLQTSHTVTWDEFNKRQKEVERKKGELEADEARMMREYRAQLDAERASKLARGRNHADKRLSSEKGKKEKDKDGRNNKRKKRSRKRHRDSSSDSDSDLSSGDNERHTSRKERSKLKRYKKERKQKSRQKRSRSLSDDSSSECKEYGPVPLSSFFDKQKD